MKEPNGRKVRKELSAAIKLKEWHRILHYLRLCAPSFQAASLARERGIAYDAIGFPDHARVFESQAIQFAGAGQWKPTNSLGAPGFVALKW